MSGAPRIISLIASSTEIVCALGLQEYLVGRSHECDYPPAVKTLPQCTSPKFNTQGTSYQIDQRVKAIVQEGLSVYRVDADLLEALAPTHIITQSQCQVCAVSLSDVEQAVCQIVSSKPKIVSLEPNSLADIWNDMTLIGAALNIEKKAQDLVVQLRQKMDIIASLAQSSSTRPRVACIEWMDPLMAAGNWMPELIALAGGENLFGEAGKHSPWMEWQQLVDSNPDVIVVTPCGFDNQATLREIELLTSKRQWWQLDAVRSNRAYIADGNQFFNRPGPRVLESLEMMAEMLHPDLFSLQNKHQGWMVIP